MGNVLYKIVFQMLTFQVLDEKILLTNTENNTIVQDTNKSNKEDVIQSLKDPNSEVRAGIVMP